MIRFCRNCLYPETKPSIRFSADGLCSACQWNERKLSSCFYTNRSSQNLIKLIDQNKINPAYDCIIPVSGGKDSTYQVWRILSLGLNPLCITAPTDLMTPIGRRNLDNIKNMGVDHIEFSVDIQTRRQINKYALINVGDIQWPEHVLIFTIPVHAAVMFEIPIIIWGENTVREYGAGRQENEEFGVTLSREYMEENCGFNGLRVSDLSDAAGIDPKKLFLYSYPEADTVTQLGVKGIFLDDYFPWNGMTNQLVARTCGFEVASHNILGTLTNYENLDNYYHGIHDYLKYLKYGFGRATDVACNWIRRGLISRDDAKQLISEIDGAYPALYLDKSLSDILSTINITIEEFNIISDEYTNYSLFQTTSSGELVTRADGSPILINQP